MLDEIIAFDKAEVDGPYIGQLNMSIVSSFCGPQGLIWGLDIAAHNELYKTPLKYNTLIGSEFSHKGKTIKVYDANYLVDATEALFGTNDKKKFIIRPGAHVPFAGKNKKIDTASTIYGAIAIGIPKNRKKDACLLMEDIGVLENEYFRTTPLTIHSNIIRSIIEIGINQNIEYEQCFVALKSCKVLQGQIGCALVAAPYFTLAKSAVPRRRNLRDFKAFLNMDLDTWKKSVK